LSEKITRFGVSIPNRLLVRFDEHIAVKGYANRSEALRDLIRDYLVEREWEADEETVGTVTLVYDHHVRELADALTHIQHEIRRQRQEFPDKKDVGPPDRDQGSYPRKTHRRHRWKILLIKKL
jgi:Arc/MetJ-type ribon-helix-helix transcriptional regulator